MRKMNLLNSNLKETNHYIFDSAFLAKRMCG